MLFAKHNAIIDKNKYPSRKRVPYFFRLDRETRRRLKARYAPKTRESAFLRIRTGVMPRGSPRYRTFKEKAFGFFEVKWNSDQTPLPYGVAVV